MLGWKAGKVVEGEGQLEVSSAEPGIDIVIICLPSNIDSVRGRAVSLHNEIHGHLCEFLSAGTTFILVCGCEHEVIVLITHVFGSAHIGLQSANICFVLPNVCVV